MMARSRKVLAVLALSAMTAVACGTRLPDEAFVAAEGGQGTGSGVGGDGISFDDGFDAGDGFTPDGGTDPDAGDPTAGPTGGGATSGGGGGAGTSGGSGGSGGAGGTGGSSGGGANPTPGKANYASDEGVTANQIVVGNIIARGGPLGPETFTPPFHGARAYFEDLNARGGVNGRKIRFLSCDDQENPSRNKACADGLMNDAKAFAFVANSTDAHAAGTAEAMSKRGVPDVGSEPIGSEYYKWPTLYSILGAEGYARDGTTYGEGGKVFVQTAPYRWFRQQMGITKAAVVFYAAPDIAKQAGEFVIAGLEAEGIEVVYTPNNGAGRNPADPNFDQDVINMTNAGAQAVWQTIDIAGFQRLCQSIDRFGATDQLKAVVATVNGMGDKVGEDFSAPCRNSVFANTESWPYSDTSNAEVKRFRDAMVKYDPKVRLHQWTLEGWVAAKLFTEGVASMGADVTRKGLLAWLDGQRKWNGGGVMAGIDWRRTPIDRTKPVTECIAISQWQDSLQGWLPRAKPFTCIDNAKWIFYNT